jgi:hypothetical protein
VVCLDPHPTPPPPLARQLAQRRDQLRLHEANSGDTDKHLYLCEFVQDTGVAFPTATATATTGDVVYFEVTLEFLPPTTGATGSIMVGWASDTSMDDTPLPNGYYDSHWGNGMVVSVALDVARGRISTAVDGGRWRLAKKQPHHGHVFPCIWAIAGSRLVVNLGGAPLKATTGHCR